jgi:hypothetical protein
VSLVSEALRKARQEAAAREARSRGALPTTVGASPRARRSVWGTAVVLVVVAAGAGAAITWLALGHRTESRAAASLKPPAGTVAAATAKAPAAVSNATTVAGTKPLAGVPHERTHPAPTAPAAAPAPSPYPATPHSKEPSPVAATVPSTAATTSSATPSAVAERGGERERVFVIDADLGYAKLHLDWLVYKPGASFGRINGQEIVVGSNIDGFTVEKIDPEAVTLRDRHGALVLRAR